MTNRRQIVPGLLAVLAASFSNAACFYSGICANNAPFLVDNAVVLGPDGGCAGTNRTDRAAAFVDDFGQLKLYIGRDFSRSTIYVQVRTHGVSTAFNFGAARKSDISLEADCEYETFLSGEPASFPLRSELLVAMNAVKTSTSQILLADDLIVATGDSADPAHLKVDLVSGAGGTALGVTILYVPKDVLAGPGWPAFIAEVRKIAVALGQAQLFAANVDGSAIYGHTWRSPDGTLRQLRTDAEFGVRIKQLTDVVKWEKFSDAVLLEHYRLLKLQMVFNDAQLARRLSDLGYRQHPYIYLLES